MNVTLVRPWVGLERPQGTRPSKPTGENLQVRIINQPVTQTGTTLSLQPSLDKRLCVRTNRARRDPTRLARRKDVRHQDGARTALGHAVAPTMGEDWRQQIVRYTRHHIKKKVGETIKASEKCSPPTTTVEKAHWRTPSIS